MFRLIIEQLTNSIHRRFFRRVLLWLPIVHILGPDALQPSESLHTSSNVLIQLRIAVDTYLSCYYTEQRCDVQP